MFNSIGAIIKLSTFGESHGLALGGIIDGFPAGIIIDENTIQQVLNKRRPGQSHITTDRNEDDKVKFLSGIYEQKSTGAPIGFIIENNNQQSADYENLKNVYRPSHADYTYAQKYGIRDHRGGGRSSNRESVNWIVAGALCNLLLKQNGVEVQAYVSQIGNISADDDLWHQKKFAETEIEQSLVRCPYINESQAMITYLEKLKSEGNTTGGIINCTIKNLPTGVGNPVFQKLQAQLAHAMLSINAAKGFEYGSGFSGTKLTGKNHNDEFETVNNKVSTKTNYSGGIQGGISNGETVYFRVAFKPISSIKQQQQTVNTNKEEVSINIKGRHDPCVVPRAVPNVEALTQIIIANNLLLYTMYK